jgi:hypothetical protein
MSKRCSAERRALAVGSFYVRAPLDARRSTLAAHLPPAAAASGRHALYFFHFNCRGLAQEPLGW